MRHLQRKVYIDADALAAACEELGIRAKVTVKLVEYVPAAAADHVRLPGRSGHLIRLGRACYRPRALEANLWHELVHCVQDERDPLWDRDYDRQFKAATVYERIPYEEEANRVASALAPLQSSEKRVIRRGYGPQEVVVHENLDACPLDLDKIERSRRRRS